jgi:hypothetical protein
MIAKSSRLRKFAALFLTLTLCWTTVGCSGSNSNTATQQAPNQTVTSTQQNRPQIASGEYPVQQASYSDGNGEYTLFLLNTPAGVPSTYRTTDLQMAQLTPEEVAAGKKSYLKIDNGQASLHLKEDFKIEYVRAVTETKTDPQTGQPQTVIVRQESGGFWAPFAGAVAGSVVGNLLFRPQYYVPPVYQPGVSVLNGYGGYGSTYNQAVNQYQTRYQAPPPAVSNRPAYLRTTGRIRSYPSGDSTLRTSPRVNTDRPTGSGFGSSTLRSSDKSRPSNYGGSSSSFGSGRSSRPARSGFGSRRR